MTGRSGERGSGISVLAARHDDDDDMDNVVCYINKERAFIIIDRPRIYISQDSVDTVNGG